MILRESGVFDGGGERSKVRLKLAMWQNYLYNLGSTRGEVAAFQDAECECKQPVFIAFQPSRERERERDTQCVKVPNKFSNSLK